MGVGDPHGLALGSYLASAAHLGVWDIVVALVIALLKTGIVLWVFMELNQHRFINQLVVLFSVGLAALLLSLMVADVLTRRTFPRAPIATEAERNGLP